MIFVTGIHGVGKTFFSQKLATKLGVKSYTASKLISDESSKVTKKVYDVDTNQKILIRALKEIKASQYILDGHVCLIDEEENVKEIAEEIFEQMPVDIIICIRENETVIQERLMKREIFYTVDFLKDFQKREIEYTKKIAQNLNIPFLIKEKSDIDENFVRKIRDMIAI